MKRIIIYSLFFVSCAKGNVEKINTNYIIRDGRQPLQVVVIDSCEYFFGDWGNGTVLTHKGNCNNPIHGK